MSARRSSPASRSDAERNRRILLEAAADALAQNPGASMAEVARAAHLTRATLYRHFTNRQELLDALRTEALLRATEAVAGSRLDEGNALEGLRRVVDAMIREGIRFRALLAEGADQDPAFVRDRAAVFSPLHDAVRRGQEAGLIRTDLPPAWIVAVMASLLATGVRASSTIGATGAVADLVFSTLTLGVATGAEPGTAPVASDAQN